QRPFEIEVKNLSCINLDPDAAYEFSCTLHRKRIFPALSVRFNLKKKIQLFNLLFDLAIVKRDKTKISLGHHKLDGCKFLKSYYSKNVFGRFYKRMRAASNFPADCPVSDNTLYEIRNYTILREEYPPNPPAMTHEGELKIQVNNKIIAYIYLLGIITY
ncbi:hypothetical protein KR044_006565, partial [Drosophila immigrans]